MARRPRGDHPGAWHHVVNRAIAKRPYFETREDKRYFLSRLAVEVRAGRIEVHAFSLMTTHYHLLLRSPAGELSEAMRRAQCAYSRFFNRRRRRDGPLIRARFYSKCIDTEPYWSAVVRYIDDNAVRAGIVPACIEHEFGSARWFSLGRRPPWLTSAVIEDRAIARTGVRSFTPRVYLDAFGPRAGEDLESMREVIEGRMRSACEVDPLEDLVGTTPRQVRDWMRRKAALADGMAVGLPVCGVSGLRRALEREVLCGGDWFLERGRQHLRGSELTWIGLLRDLCSLPVPRIAALSKRSIWDVRMAHAQFQEGVLGDGQHADRAVRVARRALTATLPLRG